jgi:hypothetical protein
MSTVDNLVRRLLKYAIEGLVVAAAAFWIPSKMKMSMQEVATIALTSMATFAVLDYFAPSFSASARAGTGLTIGAKVGGWK